MLYPTMKLFEVKLPHEYVVAGAVTCKNRNDRQIVSRQVGQNIDVSLVNSANPHRLRSLFAASATYTHLARIYLCHPW